MLQIILLADFVRVPGEWWTEDQKGLRVVRPYPFDRKRTGPVWVPMAKGEDYIREPHIEPIGLPQVLSSSSGGLKSLLGSVSKALNLGLDAIKKGALDVGTAGAEAVACSVARPAVKQ